MVEFKRKKGENFETFLRRFSKKLFQSRKLNTARQKRYLAPKKSRNLQKKRALVGLKLRDEREYQKRIGKLKEDPKKRW